MHAHRLGLLVDSQVRGRPDGNVIDDDAVVLQDLLHGNPDRRAAAPDGDEKGGLEAAAQHVHGQFHGIAQQGVGGDKYFLDRRFARHAVDSRPIARAALRCRPPAYEIGGAPPSLRRRSTNSVSAWLTAGSSSGGWKLAMVSRAMVPARSVA